GRLEGWKVGKLEIAASSGVPKPSNLPAFQPSNDEGEGKTINDLAVAISIMSGVGDVAVSENSLLVSMDDPDLHTPGIVRYLVEQGAEVMRVAEVEHSLERAYLDLVSRPDIVSADATAQGG